MIDDKHYELTVIPSSMKRFKEGILARNRNTGQFGVVQLAALKGKHARRNLKDKFRPVGFAVVDSTIIPREGDLVVVTLKDGNKVVAKCGDILPDMMATMDAIVIPPAKIMQTRVGIAANQPITEFRYLAPSLIAKLLAAGGTVKLSEEAEPAIWITDHH